MQSLTKAELKSTKTKKPLAESKRKKPLKQQGETLFGHGKPPLPHPVRAPFPRQTVASESFKQKNYDLRKRLFPSQTIATEKGHATNEKQLLPPRQAKPYLLPCKTIGLTLRNHTFCHAKPYLLKTQSVQLPSAKETFPHPKAHRPRSKSRKHADYQHHSHHATSVISRPKTRKVRQRMSIISLTHLPSLSSKATGNTSRQASPRPLLAKDLISFVNNNHSFIHPVARIFATPKPAAVQKQQA